MTSTVAWEVVPTPRIEKSPVSRKLLQSPVPEKPQPSVPKENVLTKSDLLFIKDLKPTEKSKIALMIQEVSLDLRNLAKLALLDYQAKTHPVNCYIIFFISGSH